MWGFELGNGVRSWGMVGWRDGWRDGWMNGGREGWREGWEGL